MNRLLENHRWLGWLALHLFLGLAPAHAAKQIVVFGDSLSKEYQVEFPRMPASNWIEILDKRRHEEFDIGSFEVFPDFRATGHKFNWSFPGATSWQMYENLTKSGFFQELARKEVEKHIKSSAERVLIMLGGNDLDSYYQALYQGEEPTQFTNRSYNNLEGILKWVKKRNGDLQIVLANMPHIGATPRVRSEFPTDLVKTGRVTEAVRALNARLQALAVAEGVGYADVFTITNDLVLEKPLCVSGMKFRNDSDDSANAEYIWLAGLGGKFHPNTIGQAMLANAIMDGFNRRYGAGIDPLGGSEIVNGLLEREVDFPYAQWIGNYAVGPANEPDDDADYDGLTNAQEFALDQDPAKAEDDFHAFNPRVSLDSTSGKLRLRFRPRIERSAHLEAVVQKSTDLRTWEDLPLSQFAADQNGFWTWETPALERQPFFTRLRVRLLPAP